MLKHNLNAISPTVIILCSKAILEPRGKRERVEERAGMTAEFFSVALDLEGGK